MDQPLPDLQQSVLDPEALTQLITDIQTLTEVVEVIPKGSPAGYVAEPGAPVAMDLELARDLLLAGELHGLQIRYQHDGAQWWDTLLQSPQGIKIVRIRHEFDHDNSPI
ncbi:hypothetical protein [Sulfuriroseicoccus oceanibius]|uniref:Uncharacterized protein n=1 Tax=Sulfuriroseicoccus oceanibius TaxID=2707525 RepID=A0A6B3LER2_9BACT|nr:hypothetical protein [Sulfuriroseicoccus oceanibius]QQL44859.1 hypothetical protein G3M56_013430 [Sulfuriroseicoccus oceanibius]